MKEALPQITAEMLLQVSQKRWFHNTRPNAVQGLIYDEVTGRNVAVAYDPSDTPLLAAAPALLAALDNLQANPSDPRAHRQAFDAMKLARGQE